jgi:glutamyl/glutaminyl-tRNA synthetase
MHTRFAPTPSGFLHMGNAFSFLLTWLMARQAQGHILLRIDDLDAERKRPECVQDIFDSLLWLGLDWDAGPQNADSFEKEWSQQHRIQKYQQMIEKISESADHVFACTCSRQQLRQSHSNGRYAGFCENKNIPINQADTALRIKVHKESEVSFKEFQSGALKIAVGRETGSFIIRRREGIPAYHIASICDDIEFNIDFIVRGADLLHSTSAQLFIANCINAHTFTSATFLHHPLLYSHGGDKLSKSTGDTSLQFLRKSGETPARLIQAFARACGMTGKLPSSLTDLRDAFDPGIHSVKPAW